MKVIQKSRLSKKYFVIVLMAVVVLVCIFSIFRFPSNSSVKEQSVKKAQEVQEPKVESVPAAVPKSEAPVDIPDLVADYSIPSISGGLAPVIYKLSTEQKVVFLGIDDGAFKDQSVVDIMKQNNIKASLFLTKSSIAGNPDFFKQLVDQGSVIENHTLGHDTKMITTQNYDQQKAEICGMSDYIELHYGSRPTLFRPPGGAYSDTLRQATADCGMKAVVTWVAKANGGSMQYQIGDKLRAGDIVLMHFRPEFAQDMKAFVDAMNVSGLQTALLEDAL